MTPREALAAMRARCEAATPRPWQTYEPSEFPGHYRIARRGHVEDEWNGGYVARLVPSHEPRGCDGSAPPRREDAVFIAAARTDMPKLLAVAEAALAASMVDAEVNDEPHRALDAALAALGEEP